VRGGSVSASTHAPTSPTRARLKNMQDYKCGSGGQDTALEEERLRG
jgi:hypothetical protein